MVKIIPAYRHIPNPYEMSDSRSVIVRKKPNGSYEVEHGLDQWPDEQFAVLKEVMEFERWRRDKSGS